MEILFYTCTLRVQWASGVHKLNQFLYVHDRFVLYFTIFLFMSGIFIYSGNLPLSVLFLSFSSDIVYVECLDSCVVLIFPYWRKLISRL